MSDLNKLYDDQFYDAQISGAYESAKVYAVLFALILKPESVADVGCGRGAWLKAFKEQGAKQLIGFDGDWNNQKNMIEESIRFIPCDLNQSIVIANGEKVDLAISVEVAEHLPPSSAGKFVESLVGISDMVLFGAAFTGQGGINHINEQPSTYWAALFASHNYVPFDIFRPYVWGNSRVQAWYQQNTFLYVRKDSPSYTALLSKNISPMPNISFMDCVHPSLYFSKFRPTTT